MAEDTTMLLSARGAFYQVSLADAASSSVSFNSVEHLTYNPDDRSPFSPILIDGIRTRESDIVSRTPCLNNFKVYYSFGSNFGDISVTGSVLLGPLGHVNTHGAERLRDFFATYRVSVYQRAIKINLLDKAYSMFLEGLQIMEVDKEYHILPFALFGTQIDLSRTAPPNVNPTTIVLSDANLDDDSLAIALAVSQPTIPAAATTSPTTAASTAASNNATSTAVSTKTTAPKPTSTVTSLTTPPGDPTGGAAYLGVVTSVSAVNAYNAIQNPATPVPATNNSTAIINGWNNMSGIPAL